MCESDTPLPYLDEAGVEYLEHRLCRNLRKPCRADAAVLARLFMDYGPQTHWPDSQEREAYACAEYLRYLGFDFEQATAVVTLGFSKVHGNVRRAFALASVLVKEAFDE